MTSDKRTAASPVKTGMQKTQNPLLHKNLQARKEQGSRPVGTSAVLHYVAKRDSPHTGHSERKRSSLRRPKRKKESACFVQNDEAAWSPFGRRKNPFGMGLQAVHQEGTIYRALRPNDKTALFEGDDYFAAGVLFG